MIDLTKFILSIRTDEPPPGVGPGAQVDFLRGI
jgi:hypothetical protein